MKEDSKDLLALSLYYVFCIITICVASEWVFKGLKFPKLISIFLIILICLIKFLTSVYSFKDKSYSSFVYTSSWGAFLSSFVLIVLLGSALSYYLFSPKTVAEFSLFLRVLSITFLVGYLAFVTAIRLKRLDEAIN